MIVDPNRHDDKDFGVSELFNGSRQQRDEFLSRSEKVESDDLPLRLTPAR